MPIYSVGNDSNKEVHFGTGDIKVSSGWLIDDKKVGVLVFRQQAPRPIGGLEESVPFEELDEGVAPVRFVFNKAESVDVVIERLKKVKEYMVNAK
jgi:hypothetical protein